MGIAGAFVSVARAPNARAALWQGLGFGTGYFAVALSWIVEPFLVDPLRHGWMAPFAIVSLSVGLALFWAAAFWGAKKLARPVDASAVWPLILTWTLAELARAYVLTGFPWAMPSHVLVDRGVGQGAAFVGAHGLNLLVFGGAWICACAVIAQGRARLCSRAAAAVVVGGLAWPLASSVVSDASETARPIVRLIQPNAPQHQKWDPEFVGVFFQRLITATAAVPKDGAPRPDLIVWPETAVPVLLNQAQDTLAVIAGAAKGVPVVLGINRLEGARIYNAAVVLDSTGQISATYDKHHLVPFGEFIPLGNLLERFGISGMASRSGGGFSPGPGPAVLDLGAAGRAVLLICYEAVFPQDVRGAPERADFILHLTNDAWFGSFSGPYQHLAQARMRAIESGLPVLRAANTGVSAAIDAQGRVLASVPLNTMGHLDVAVPAARPVTLYARSGDVPWMVLVVLLLVNAGFRRRRKFN